MHSLMLVGIFHSHISSVCVGIGKKICLMDSNKGLFVSYADQNSHVLSNPLFVLSVVLGNAYLSLFFMSNQDPKILKQCTSAYNQAVSTYTQYGVSINDRTKCSWYCWYCTSMY